MLDPMNRRRFAFDSGRSVRLADGQDWPLPKPQSEMDSNSHYHALVNAILEADRNEDLLRAELALGIHLLAMTYDIPPLILGSLLDYPQGDDDLTRLQDDLHEISMDHLRVYRPLNPYVAEMVDIPRIPRRSTLLARVRASISA